MTAPGVTVEVVIPTFGRQDSLHRAVESVLAQTYSNTRVVVVDDCSPGAAPHFDHGRVRVVRQPRNMGPAAARNVGVATSDAEFVSFLDDDDLLEADRIEIGLISAGRGVVTICGRTLVRGASRETIPYREFRGDMSRTLLNESVPHLGQALLHRSDFLPFDESMRSSEDWEWWLRTCRSVTFDSSPRVGYVQNMHAEERHGRGDRVHLENRKRLVAKHASYFAGNRFAHAFALQRIGQAALSAGLPGTATLYFLRSVSRRPRLNGLFMVGAGAKAMLRDRAPGR